jgi:acyl-coenzyme A thioesterase PaaI-like protein
MIDPAASIPARVGIVPELADGEFSACALEPYPALCHHGVVRASVWALMADMVGGLSIDKLAGEDWVFTTDLSVRVPVAPAPRRVLGTAVPLRIGRGNAASEVFMREPDGTLVAYGQTDFTRLARRPDDPPKPGLADGQVRWPDRERIDLALSEAAGIAVVDASRGVVEVELADELRNPAGAMQGGMVALVGEVAAEEIVGHHVGTAQVVTDLDIRYLAMGRVGPIVTEAGLIGPAADASVHVLLRDRGNGDRVVAAIMARTATAPAPA